MFGCAPAGPAADWPPMLNVTPHDPSDHRAVDHLVCFAGDSTGGGVQSAGLPAALRAVESKFWAQFYVGRHGRPRVKRACGSLTFTSGSGPRPHQAIATVAANAGVSLLAEALAKELAPARRTSSRRTTSTRRGGTR